MRRSTAALGLIAAAGVAVLIGYLPGRAQERAPAPASAASATPAPSVPAVLDFHRLPPLQQQLALCAQRGADWLCRANRPDGRFVYGYLPDLKRPLEGEHFLQQAGAALALARAARYTGNGRCAAVARQALLTLLLDTAPDAHEPHLRSTTLPPLMVNPVAAAGLLVAAIHELPAPGEDLLEQGEQLCLFIRSRQRADGSLDYGERGAAGAATPEHAPALGHCPAMALAGLMRSQGLRPADWKLDVVRKALPYYAAHWRADKEVDSLPWHMAAFAEAYVRTREPGFAAVVNEMADWLCGLQYVRLDARHPLWLGGFMGWDGGQAVAEPRASSAMDAEALADACRAARQAGDLDRYRRYREAVERGLQFVTALQYTDANTQHFADWYREVLVGGFHGSHQDGTLRIDYTQYAVCALLRYLGEVAN